MTPSGKSLRNFFRALDLCTRVTAGRALAARFSGHRSLSAALTPNRTKRSLPVSPGQISLTADSWGFAWACALRVSARHHTAWRVNYANHFG